MKPRFIRKRSHMFPHPLYGAIRICEHKLVRRDGNIYYHSLDGELFSTALNGEVPVVCAKIPDEDFKRAIKTNSGTLVIKLPATPTRLKLVDKCESLLINGFVIINLFSFNKHVYMRLESVSKRLCTVSTIEVRDSKDRLIGYNNVKEPMVILTMDSVLLKDCL